MKMNTIRTSLSILVALVFAFSPATARIPDLIAAAPGFITTEKMPTNRFRAKDLGFYVNSPGL